MPRGFQVINQAQQVGMVNEEQSAQLVFQIMADANSAREAASSFVQQVSGQQGTEIVDQGQTTSSGDIPARYVLVEGQTQQGQSVRALLYFLEYGNNVYTFQGLTAAQRYSSYEDVFLQVMRGFAPLNDPDILNVQPARLQLQTVAQPAPFDSFVPGTLPEGLTPEGLAIMNQVQLNQQMDSSRVLKLPGQ